MICYTEVRLMDLRCFSCFVNQVVIENLYGLKSYWNLLTSGFILIWRSRLRKDAKFKCRLVWVYFRCFYWEINFVEETQELLKIISKSYIWWWNAFCTFELKTQGLFELFKSKWWSSGMMWRNVLIDRC